MKDNNATPNTTSVQVSYRYNSTNGSKSTKTTVDKYIYEMICKKKGVSDGQSFITDLARRIREEEPNRWAGHLRESLILELINKEYTVGYTISPDYKKVLCTNNLGASVPVNIPSSLHFALTSFFNGMSPNPSISEIYSLVDGSDTINKSSELRKILLQRLL
ncbi:hypothetical protein [Photobacterium damselae]|uniref:hypothetical protein n=1 Tax=Photobacterium damselae TaxID=38293 RepID=UPI001F1CB2B0|nr:hypothetical protein [Photobacterium damselae]UKA04571.1 hypothetical protein IHC89_23420 [Photobacterium damselae subsp. damselae]